MVGADPRMGRAAVDMPDEQAGENVAAPRLAVVGGVRFEVVAGRNLLFSAAGQSVFEINDTAAHLWRAIEDGREPAAIQAELVQRGVPPPTAEAYLHAAITEWSRLRLVTPLPGSSGGGAGAVAPIQDIRVAGVIARIRHAASLADSVAPVFAHLETEGQRHDVMLDVVERGEQVEVFRDGGPACRCARDEVATILKAQILDEVLERAGYALALHAAALLRNGRMLLLVGQPGAGKTTLALALVQAGFGFAGDDLALLDQAGQVMGVPFAPAVKAGAWSLLGACRPDLLDSPVFRRPDGMLVRYPRPQGLAASAAHPVGWLVVLHRRPGAAAALMPLDAADALRCMLQDAFTCDRRLHAAGFTAVARCLDKAGCFRLVYSALGDAVALLQRNCR